MHSSGMTELLPEASETAFIEELVEGLLIRKGVGDRFAQGRLGDLDINGRGVFGHDHLTNAVGLTLQCAHSLILIAQGL